MFRRTIATIALAAALLTAVSCGGGDEKTIDLGDGNKVTVGGDLPDSFPDDFPIYDGADLQTAAQGEQEGIEGIVATWTTGDDFDDVKNFYDDEFGNGPWTTVGDGTVGGMVFWAVENGDQTGYVSVTDGDDVSITAIVGDDASVAVNPDEGTDDASDEGGDEASEDDDSGSDGGASDLPDEVELSDDFPTDRVSLPDDIRVTGSSSISASGAQTHFVTFFSKDSTDDLAAFFKDQLEGKGYSQSIQTSDGNGIYAAYAENDDGTGAIVVVTVAESTTDPAYREVGLQITVS